MYEAYFGLRERPFSIAPDPRYLYLGGHHREALAHLLYGVTERGGFVQITGEVGTGKTTLTRALLEQLPDDVDVALILNPNVTVREFLIAICDELGVEAPKRSYSSQALMDSLTDYLLKAYARGRHTVVLVDEAQNLSHLVLEQVRLLTNLETSKQKLLQIILVGQPELRELLARPDLRQVAQRITARYHLAPLSYAETRHYLRHRAAIAGVDRPLFSAAAVRAIHRRAQGIPRLINVISDRALLGAYATGRHRVDWWTARKAASEISGSLLSRWRLPAAAVLATALAAAGAYAVMRPGPTRAPAPMAAPATLTELLAQAGPRADLNSAFAALFDLWGAGYTGRDAQTACEQAGRQGLRCFYEQANWNTLQQRNLPAVIELLDSENKRVRAVLTGLRGEQAVLQLAGRELMVPAAEIQRHWSKDYLLLWRPPLTNGESIVPGQKGSAVVWLLQRLDRIEGRSTPIDGEPVFDAALEQRVREFQRARGLTVDGIVGEKTLILLLATAPDSGTPVLRR